MQLAAIELEQVAELLMGLERPLRAGANMDAAILAAPADGAQRLEMDMLDAGG
jgi:hypothetical protein